MDLSNLTGDDEDDAFTAALLGQMKISYKIILPFKVGDNNATTVSEDGKTLEWTLKAGQTNEIKFTAEEDHTMMIVGVGIVVLVVVVGIFIVVYKKKGETKEQNKAKPATTKKEVVKETKTVETKKEASKEVKKEEPKTQTKQQTTKEVKPQEKKEETKEETKQEEKKDNHKKEEK